MLMRNIQYTCLFMATACLSGCAWWAGNEAADDVGKVAASSEIEVVWSTDVDTRKPADALAYGHVAIAGQGDAARVVIGGRDAHAHIYDMSGSEQFRVALLEASDSGAAALASGIVVLGDTGAVLYGIDPMLGKIVWQLNLSSPVTGTPVAIADDVLVQTTDNRIYRVSSKGEKLWSFAGQPGGLGLYLNASPLFHDGRIFALLTNGDAIALDAQSGDLIWRKQLLLDTDASHLGSLRAPQAVPVWMSELNLDGNRAVDLIFFSFYQGEVFALNRDDGNTLLSHTMSLKSSPLIKGGNVYVADIHGVVQALEQSSGTVLWQQKLSTGELVGPVLFDGDLWLADDLGHVFRVDMQGNIRAHRQLPGAIDRSPVVTTEGIFVHSSLGGLYLVH